MYYEHKYLKYKNKYKSIAPQIGGAPDINIRLHNEWVLASTHLIKDRRQINIDKQFNEYKKRECNIDLGGGYKIGRINLTGTFNDIGKENEYADWGVYIKIPLNEKPYPIIDFNDVYIFIKLYPDPIPTWNLARKYQAWAYYDFIYSDDKSQQHTKSYKRQDGIYNIAQFTNIPIQYCDGLATEATFGIQRNNNTIYFLRHPVHHGDPIEKIRISDNMLARKREETLLAISTIEAKKVDGMTLTKILSFTQETPVSGKSWFHQLFGFPEDPKTVRKNFKILGNPMACPIGICAPHIPKPIITSTVNKRKFFVGHFGTPTLKELRDTCAKFTKSNVSIFTEVVGDIFNIQSMSTNKGALFQAASQFNCLEFASQDLTPEDGITMYQKDRTQGPACAISTGAATLYRNYFVPQSDVNSRDVVGQNTDTQINNLDSVLNTLDIDDPNKYITVKNGYTESSDTRLKELNMKLTNPNLERKLIEQFKIGIHSNTSVTFSEKISGQFIEPTSTNLQLVSHAYCSAISVGYSSTVKDIKLWTPFAKLVLKAAYEATLWAGIINKNSGGSNRVILTKVGAGVFRNKHEWVVEAIGNAICKTDFYGLEIILNYYDEPEKKELSTRYNTGITKIINTHYKSQTEELCMLIYKNTSIIVHPFTKYIAADNTGTQLLKRIVNMVNERGQTPLYIAARSGNMELVSILYKTDGDLNKPNSNINDTSTPLIGLLWGWIENRKDISKNEILEMYKSMVDAGANEQYFNNRDESGYSFKQQIINEYR